MGIKVIYMFFIIPADGGEVQALLSLKLHVSK